MNFVTTKEYAELLGVTLARLEYGIRHGKAKAAWRDATGRLWWDPDQRETVRAALANDRRRRRPAAEAAK